MLKIFPSSANQAVFFSSLPNIHIRTLSSGCIHPRSSTLGLIDSGTNFAEYENFALRIHDDRLALMASASRHIQVWNWKTGQQIAKIASLVLGIDRIILLTICAVPVVRP